MDSIIVEKKALLEALEENLDVHVSEYEAAVEEYRTRLSDRLADLMDRIEDGEMFDPAKQFRDLPMPQSFEKEYERAIGMLRMDTQDTVELTDWEYTQYVQDEWTWKGKFSESTQIYNG